MRKVNYVCDEQGHQPAGGRTLVVFYDVSQVVSAAVVRLSHAHGVVREVDIAVIAWCYRIAVRLSHVAGIG